MRTTVTLDPDTESLVRQLMAERKVSFKEALNDAIRSGAGGRPAESFRGRVAEMGVPTVNLDRALQLAGELDDEEFIRSMRSGR